GKHRWRPLVNLAFAYGMKAAHSPGALTVAECVNRSHDYYQQYLETEDDRSRRHTAAARMHDIEGGWRESLQRETERLKQAQEEVDRRKQAQEAAEHQKQVHEEAERRKHIASTHEYPGRASFGWTFFTIGLASLGSGVVLHSVSQYDFDHANGQPTVGDRN